MTVAEVAVRFDGRPRGKGWIASCPSHEDAKPSLSIDHADNGGVLVKCRAGCSLPSVIGAVGLTLADLAPANGNGQRTNRAPVVATYIYRDVEGDVRYRKQRTADKQFFFTRPDSCGGWIASAAQNGGRPVMDGVERLLYRLNELREQSEGSSSDTFCVYVVEGEKDADRLWSVGLPATTSDAGASGDLQKPKWTEALTRQLRDVGATSVACLPDNDSPGRAHMEAAAQSFAAAGIEARIVALPGLPPKGDVSDWLDAGHSRHELVSLVNAAPSFVPADVPARAVLPAPDSNERERTMGHPARSVHLTPASTIQVRAVRWFWLDRLALGTLALIGGREGIGKSICAYTLAAMATRGHLRGACFGTPRAVIIVATEDSWEHTIVPRLMAADADLTRIYRADVRTSDLGEAMLSLPRDGAALEKAIHDVDAAFILLDPLLSRLDSALDTHKDAEVRQALEPLVALADRTRCVILGFIHVNKSASTDALTTLMGSRAFAAVARSVLFVITDPNDEHTRLLGQAKNNLGRMDLPTLTFRIVETHVADTPEGPVYTGKLEWMGESDLSIRDALDASREPSGDKTATSEAMGWLEDYLRNEDGQADSAAIKAKGRAAGHSTSALQRARQRLKVTTIPVGFPRRTFWTLQSSRARGETSTTEMNETTGTTDRQLSQSLDTPRKGDTTTPQGWRLIAESPSLVREP